MIGKTLSHYKILEQIGAGGMGVVYRARDERLERDVALKVLPADALPDEDARKRFRKEALALSSLNHPNIATVFDFDHQEGVDFLAMEFIAGESLAEKLQRGPLSEKEIASLGGQIASALDEAHEHGVVHRDLKPGNVMVTPKGQAKVLDFGLAKLLRSGGDADLTRSVTETKAVAGTLPYMAPEQLSGEPLDARTDIHALGAVLYEMATGQRPFREQSVPRLTDAILHQPPVSARVVNARVSPELDRIILKCLEKDPENRYQSAKEVAVDLRRLASPTGTTAAAPAVSVGRKRPGVVLTAGIALVAVAAVLLAFNAGGLRERLLGRAGPPQIKAIAVLPLENLSRDPEQEYFTDGMTEALISNLAQIGALRVISRTSVMQYKGARKPLPQIAKELGVDAVVEGSVQRAGDRVKITAQLIHAATDTHLWAREYERDLRDVLSLQREVAGAIVNEIRVQLDPADRARLTAVPAAAKPVNPAAYEAYLLAGFHRDRAGPEGRRKAIESFRKALELDPDYALAHAGLAEVYASLGTASVLGVRPQEVMPKAKEHALRALELDPNLAEAHTALGLVQLSYEWDFAAAERQFQQALKLNPNDVNTYHWYSHLWTARVRFEESYAASRRALELDPLNVQMRAHLAWHYVMAGQFEQAVRECDRTLEIHPGSPEAWLFRSWAYSGLGKHNEAITAARKAIEFSGDNPRMVLGLAFAHGRAGRQSEAKALLSRFVAPSKAQLVPPYDMAQAYVALGNHERAMEWLERAYQERNDYIIYLRVDPFFEPLRSDPRFQALLRRINLPE